MSGHAGAAGSFGSWPRFVGTRPQRTDFPSGVQSMPPVNVALRKSVSFRGADGFATDTTHNSVPLSVATVNVKFSEVGDQEIDPSRAPGDVETRAGFRSSIVRIAMDLSYWPRYGALAAGSIRMPASFNIRRERSS